MSSEVKVASSTIHLGFLSALIHLIRWPDWQLPALFTRGFKVAEDIEPSNVYPRVAPAAIESEHSLLDSTEAEKWNESLANESRLRIWMMTFTRQRRTRASVGCSPNRCLKPKWSFSSERGAGRELGEEV